jgi:lipopolysaccharide biosynthesis regulator YciM
MTNALALLLIVILAGIIYLLYREYRHSRTPKLPAYTEALTDLLDGRKDAAYAKLKETVNRDSDNVDAYLRLAGLMMERGQNDRAGRIYQMLGVRRNLATPDRQKILLALAREHLRANRVNKAISVLEQMSELDPRDITSREILLFIYAQNDRWDDVMPVLDGLVKLQKDRHKAALYCTEIGARICVQQPETAARCFEQALQLDSKLMPAIIYTGDALYLQGKMNAAVDKWKEVLGQKPELSFMVLDRLEKAFYEAGRYEDMVKVYEDLLRKSEVRGQRSEPGILTSAISNLTSAVPSPQSPVFVDMSLYVALARIYAKKGDIAKAQSVLGRLPPEKRSTIPVRLMAADLRLNQGSIEETRLELARIEDQLARDRFRCSRCGFAAEGDYAWHCPQCGAWESFKKA